MLLNSVVLIFNFLDYSREGQKGIREATERKKTGYMGKHGEFARS